MGEFSKEVNATFESERLKAMLNIKYTANFIATITANELDQFNLSAAQYNILRILRGAKKPITMKLVKERMIEKSPNSTRLVDKLCEKELIQRVRCENDRRAIYVSITSKGLDLLTDIVFEQGPKQMNNLTNDEAILLNKLLDKVRS